MEKTTSPLPTVVCISCEWFSTESDYDLVFECPHCNCENGLMDFQRTDNMHHAKIAGVDYIETGPITEVNGMRYRS